MTSQIIWLASYPKSGNTLIRSIITSLFFSDCNIFKLENLKKIGQFEETSLLLRNKKLFGNDFSNIHQIEVLYKYLIQLQSAKCLNVEKNKIIFLKTHSGLFKVLNNSFTDQSRTKGIIYIVRDPRDVCISWSKHSGKDINQSINFMIDENRGLHWNESNEKKVFSKHNLPLSYISSWSRHVLSWTSIKWDIPKMLIRFEDLVYNKEKTIRDIIKFFQINFNANLMDKEKKIKNILETTSFDNMQYLENKFGFSEKLGYNKFFSVGKKDQWKKRLNKEQIEQIEMKFGYVMNELNYKLSVEI